MIDDISVQTGDEWKPIEIDSSTCTNDDDSMSAASTVAVADECGIKSEGDIIGGDHGEIMEAGSERAALPGISSSSMKVDIKIEVGVATMADLTDTLASDADIESSPSDDTMGLWFTEGSGTMDH